MILFAVSIVPKQIAKGEPIILRAIKHPTSVRLFVRLSSQDARAERYAAEDNNLSPFFPRLLLSLGVRENLLMALRCHVEDVSFTNVFFNRLTITHRPK